MNFDAVMKKKMVEALAAHEDVEAVAFASGVAFDVPASRAAFVLAAVTSRGINLVVVYEDGSVTWRAGDDDVTFDPSILKPVQDQLETAQLGELAGRLRAPDGRLVPTLDEARRHAHEMVMSRVQDRKIRKHVARLREQGRMPKA